MYQIVVLSLNISVEIETWAKFFSIVFFLILFPIFYFSFLNSKGTVFQTMFQDKEKTVNRGRSIYFRNSTYNSQRILKCL